MSGAGNCWDGQDGLEGLDERSLSSRSDEVGVSYEAISTSNRTVQRGSRFAKPRLNGR